jgi:protein tyrosine phosphatase (PTP) superfamily phosphohydrolase (DUF442 family)
MAVYGGGWIEVGNRRPAVPPADIEDIINYLSVSDAIGTAGQPTSQQFMAIREAGYEVVVNLAMPDSSNALPNERELVAEQGMLYFHIPVVWECPTAQDLEQFFDVMARSHGRRVFVHCAMNMRVSVFVYLYRVIWQGIAPDAAYANVLRIWRPNPVWQRFLEDSLVEYGIRA